MATTLRNRESYLTGGDVERRRQRSGMEESREEERGREREGDLDRGWTWAHERAGSNQRKQPAADSWNSQGSFGRTRSGGRVRINTYSPGSPIFGFSAHLPDHRT
ncbi:hypothetical protein BT93_H1224 [Corymbia citriodora subsp. variegata]|nr:hypothetical protein BT93_H1224 [Corymbia citriodora subsp. variegata]